MKRLHCIKCLDPIESETERCERCVGETGRAPRQKVTIAQRRAVEIVASIIADDLMDRREIKWPLERVRTEDYETWAELVKTNVENVLAVMDARP